MTRDAYRDIADRYDLFFEEFGRHGAAEVRFYQRLFTENRVRSVLDCACGTGHDLVMFADMGLDVVGSDLSASMLERARQNLGKRVSDIPLAVVDYRELSRHYSRRFDAVVCLSTSILEAGDEREILRAIRSMHEVLRPGGVILLSQGTTDKQWEAKPRFVAAVNRPDFSRVLVIDYLERGARYNVLDLFHGTDRKELVVWSREYPVMLLRDDYEVLLKTADFGDIRFFGSYGFEAYDKARSDMLLVVARKRSNEETRSRGQTGGIQ
jgi:glycine/sarcosine N-methyltransferase